VASERGVARAGRTDETTNVIHAFRPEGRSGASEFRVGLEIEMALHRSRSEDESDLWTDALHARLEAPRASNDADVSSIPPIIPYGGFSSVRLEGWLFRRRLPKLLSV
jgi:hypothetical protein